MDATLEMAFEKLLVQHPPPPFDVLIAVGTSMSSHVDLMNKYVLNQPIYYILILVTRGAFNVVSTIILHS